jgi:pyruvate ferredoxin oxidoreductase gamma subunit
MAEKMIEIRWHGRGGQGAVTASKVFADSALATGKKIQAFPEYGSERQGAPVKSFTRISDDPITIHSQVNSPDIVVVLDPTLLKIVDVTEGLAKNGKLIVNTTDSPENLRAELKLDGREIYTIDATGISLKHLGKAIPNTPMIGALVKASEMIDINLVADDFKKKFQGKFREDVIEGNVNAILEAFNDVKGEA